MKTFIILAILALSTSAVHAQRQTVSQLVTALRSPDYMGMKLYYYGFINALLRNDPKVCRPLATEEQIPFAVADLLATAIAQGRVSGTQQQDDLDGFVVDSVETLYPCSAK